MTYLDYGRTEQGTHTEGGYDEENEEERHRSICRSLVLLACFSLLGSNFRATSLQSHAVAICTHALLLILSRINSQKKIVTKFTAAAKMGRSPSKKPHTSTLHRRPALLKVHAPAAGDPAIAPLPLLLLRFFFPPPLLNPGLVALVVVGGAGGAA